MGSVCVLWCVCMCVCVCSMVNPLQSDIYLRLLSWQPITGNLLMDSVGWHKRLVITLAIKVRQLLHPLHLATWVINLACLG